MPGLSWTMNSIAVYGRLPWAVAALALFVLGAVLSLFPAFACWIAKKIGGGRLATELPALAGVWTLAEWLRGDALANFGWLMPGYAVIDTPLAGWAPLGGIYAVTLAQLLFAALVAVFHGVVVQTLSNPNVFAESPYWDLGWLSIPITVLWIVGITNAVNLIDGLDGLACGVSTISAISMLVIALLVSESDVALVMAALVGACLGFMPYNKNPAKMFMGDTGSTFLGYILATISIQGLFKYYAIVSFAVPFLILGLPMFDTLFAIIRRLAHGQNPMAPDRGHIHHRLIDMGLNQKQAVAALYVISSILGLSAVVLTSSGAIKAMLFLMALAVAAFLASRVIFRRDIDKAMQAEKAAAEEKSTETATPAETVPAEPEEESNEEKKEEA